LKKNGFTLVELIVTIALIGLLIGFGSSYLIKYFNNLKQESYEIMVVSVEAAAKSYVDDNKYSNEALIPSEGEGYIITTEILIENDYLDSSMSNPKTGEKLTGNEKIEIKADYEGNLRYEYKG